MLVLEKATDSGNKVVIKEETCEKTGPCAKIVVLENNVIRNEEEISDPQVLTKEKAKKPKSKLKNTHKQASTTKARAQKAKSKQRRKMKLKIYYSNVRKKFGWGLDPDTLTQEQLAARARLKTRDFKTNICPLCKSRFRMRCRMNLHIKKQTCSCKFCGLIYESAFQRSDHRWTCEIRLKSENIKTENPLSNVNRALISPLWGRPPVISNTPEIVLPTQPSTHALGVLLQSFPSESNFTLPTLALDFWPSRIKQPLCPVENDKFNTRTRLDQASEPSFGFETVAETPSNSLGKEIRSLLVNDKLDFIKDF